MMAEVYRLGMQRRPRQYCVRECAQLCLTTRIKLTPAAAKLNPAASEVVAPSITNPVDPSRSVMPTTAGKVAAPNTIRISPAAEDPPHAPTIMSSNPSPLISCDLISAKSTVHCGIQLASKTFLLFKGRMAVAREGCFSCHCTISKPAKVVRGNRRTRMKRGCRVADAHDTKMRGEAGRCGCSRSLSVQHVEGMSSESS